jgi:hypothetical protein
MVFPPDDFVWVSGVQGVGFRICLCNIQGAAFWVQDSRFIFMNLDLGFGVKG